MGIKKHLFYLGSVVGVISLIHWLITKPEGFNSVYIIAYTTGLAIGYILGVLNEKK